ncbi:unnamed protein product [Paramecium sonneborni]|uniref:Uncharacterized protein n=1 Tax=Paramecium sonneborni TaxID=65129 RepID=A0A8S1KDQ6_9CILI|nr:unnamed protein product [Paramecium sonneborni]
MKMNERLQFQSNKEEFNLDKEASDIAQRIMERVRQRSTAKSAQKELTTQYLRASDYKTRQLFQSNQLEIRRESEKVTKGPSQEIKRKEEIFVPEFKISKDNRPYELVQQENQLKIEDLKIPLKIPPQLHVQGIKDIYQKTVKINNYESIGFQEQKNEKRKQNQIMNEYIQPENNQIHQLSSKRISSPKRNHLKLDSNYQTKSSLSLKTTQLQTPVSVQFKQQDIVSQLLGSLKNQKKNYGEYLTKR